MRWYEMFKCEARKHARRRDETKWDETEVKVTTQWDKTKWDKSHESSQMRWNEMRQYKMGCDGTKVREDTIDR